MKSKDKRFEQSLNISKLRTIIVGGNKIAVHLAEKLLQFDHNIVIIEKNYQRVKKIEDTIDLLVVEGEGIDSKILKQAEIKKTQLFIAITDNDKYNLLAGIYAKRFGVDKVIVKINNNNYLPLEANQGDIFDLVINPQQQIIKRIKDLLKPDLEFDRLIDKNCKVSKLKVEHDHKFSYQRISNIKLPKKVLLITILRGDKVIIPRGKSKIYPGDKLFFLFKKGLRYKFNKLLGDDFDSKRKAIFIGANDISYNLASLKKFKTKVTIIENDYKKCKEFAYKLDNTLVLHGNGSNIELLKEEGVKNIDIFAAVTKSDENNLLMGQLASKLGAKFSMAVVSNLIYQDISNFFAIDEVINPSLNIIDLIMDYLLRGQVDDNSLFSGKIRLEKIKYKKSKELKLKKLSLPGEALVIYIIIDGQLQIPNGETVLKKGVELSILHSSTEVKDFFK